MRPFLRLDSFLVSADALVPAVERRGIVDLFCLDQSHFPACYADRLASFHVDQMVWEHHLVGAFDECVRGPVCNLPAFGLIA